MRRPQLLANTMLVGLLVSLAAVFAVATAAYGHGWSTEHTASYTVPVKTDLIYILDPADNSFEHTPYPRVAWTTTPNITIASLENNRTLNINIGGGPDGWPNSFAIPPMTHVGITLPGPGHYSWSDQYFLGEIHYSESYPTSRFVHNQTRSTLPTFSQETFALRPFPDKPSPIETLYHRTSQVRIPTSLVTLVSAANLTVGVPSHALAPSDYVAFASPHGGPSYKIELVQLETDNPLSPIVASTANFTLPAGSNHGVDLPGDGFYYWTAHLNGTKVAGGQVSRFG